MHPRRALDILAGSILNKTKKKSSVDITTLSKAISRGQAELNEQIRASSPNFYLVDPELLATEYINYVIANPKEVLCKNPAKLTETGKAELQELFRKILNLNFKPIKIDEVITTLDNIYQSSITDISKASSRSRKIYIEFQRIAAKAGEASRKYLNSIGVRKVVDAENFVNNLDNRIAIIAPTFNIAVKNVNEKLQGAISGSSSFLKKYGISNINAIYIGNIVHSGHVGIYSNSGLLGINMPSAVIASAVSNRGDEIERAIGNLQLHIDNGIKVSPKYTQYAGMLLDLQMNFTVSMSSTINSKVLGPLEQRAIRSVVDNITNDALKEALSRQISEESLRQVFTEVVASPNLLEYLSESLAATLSGKKINTVAHSRKEIGTPEKIVSSIITNGIKGRVGKISAPTKQRAAIRNKQGQFTSLINLQALINNVLTSQIKSNMRKPALQNRTGRFAESVKVERMSQSREGMVTAFYSYMKYPYATFSKGGKQYTPTREPKILISKSIREIASTMVGNRLRAVSL